MSKTETGWLCTRSSGLVEFMWLCPVWHVSRWYEGNGLHWWPNVDTFLAEYDCEDFDPPAPGEKLLVELEV